MYYIITRSTGTSWREKDGNLGIWSTRWFSFGPEETCWSTSEGETFRIWFFVTDLCYKTSFLIVLNIFFFFWLSISPVSWYLKFGNVGGWKEESGERWKKTQIQCQVEWWGTLMCNWSYDYILFVVLTILLVVGHTWRHGSIQNEEGSSWWSYERLAALKFDIEISKSIMDKGLLVCDIKL